MIESALLQPLAGYIDGQWVHADTQFSVTNPANGETLAEVPKMGAAQTQQAIDAAQLAHLGELPSLDLRRQWLNEINQALLDQADEIGRILCMEHGKPWPEAKGEVAYAAQFFKYCADNIEVLKPRHIKEQPKGCDWTVYFRPIGVAGLIVPWNFPIAMIAKKLCAALAGGAPSVIKPASETPLTMIALFNIIHNQTNIPKGWVNLVMGRSSEIGKALCESPDVAMISFTGSTQVGKTLIKQSTDQVKKLGLELGGNAPFIIFDDADLDQAAEQLIGNKFRGGGQTCVCANRVYVHKKVYEAFTRKLTDRVSQLKVGNGLDRNIDIGPLINEQGFNKVKLHVADALDKGAELIHGPNPNMLDAQNGLFYPPSIIGQVSEHMLCCQDETFGPLVPLVSFSDDNEVLKQANHTEYGLAAYVFSQDKNRAMNIISRLKFGHVGYNTGTGPTPEAPFGGMKQSGIGREGGEEGLFEYVEPQTVPTAK